jgi:hypothetical protein
MRPQKKIHRATNGRIKNPSVTKAKKALSDAGCVPLNTPYQRPPKCRTKYRSLKKHIPMAWIKEALASTGKASIRQRKLPAEQVVWLVIALAIFRRTSMSEVLEVLELSIPMVDGSALSRSAITQARHRLGADPFCVLFERTAKAWCFQDLDRYSWKGYSLWAMDGTTLRTPDSLENRATFGAQNYTSGKVSSYPQVRGVSLTMLQTRLIADVAFGPYDRNEMRYAQELIRRIPDRSITVFDKGFFSAAILLDLSLKGDQRHFIIPAKTNVKWEVISGGPGDEIVQMKVSPQARVRHPGLPKMWKARAVHVELPDKSSRVLLTSLLDRRKYKVADLATCYARRWGVETSYSELKQTLLGGPQTLRSQGSQGIIQEIWGALMAYNLVRLEIAQAAKEAKAQPTDLSFTRALHLLQYELLFEAAGQTYGNSPGKLKQLRDQFKAALNEKRRGRKCPRHVKSRPAKYEVRFVFKRP